MSVVLPAPLRGIVTPLLTPLNPDHTLDEAALDLLIDRVLSGGVNGIFILGTTGEGPALPPATRRHLIQRACRAVAGRVPVLAGITDSSYSEVVELARVAADAGVDAVVSAGPLYYRVSQPLLLHYFERLASDSPLPLFLYNMPSCTHLDISVDTAARASDIPNIRGIKDSSGDMGYLHQLRSRLASRPEFTVLVGPEELMAESVLLGAHGGVNGGSNLWPTLYVRLYEAAAAGDLATVARLHPIVVEVCGRIFDAAGYGNHYLEGLKYAAALLGIGSGIPALPYVLLDNAGRATIQRATSEIGAKVEAALAPR
jgi:4-hydroxy-tetrahydrodipicolinate synthase